MTQPHYQIVIGLEVHVQLRTLTKLFCRCAARFGDPPNTNCCPVCLGLPGALPVLNAAAIDLATRTAVALRCEVAQCTKWDRKQYFYPDLPKGYQVSQYDLPLAQRGHLEINDPKYGTPSKRIRIRRAHLEEDAGKSMHDEQSGVSDSRVDLNRAGTPLLEIVTEPDLSSPAEARAFLRELKLLLEYINVSDCNMQEGSLRVDANVNLHVKEPDDPRGIVATPIVEVKNMNSFRAVERALEFEVQRQWTDWQVTRQSSADVPKQTRGWMDDRGVTVAMRTKEESSDYRYFPDPDLVPLMLSDEQIEAQRSTLGELPAVARARLASAYALTIYDADVLVNLGRQVVEFFEKATSVSGEGKGVSNWLQRDTVRWMNETGSSIAQYPVSAESFGAFVQKIKSGQLDSTRAPEVLSEMSRLGLTVEQAIEALGVQSVDFGDLAVLCQELLDANPQIVLDVKAGKDKAVGALIGQARQRNPNANPHAIREMCLNLIRGARS